MHRIKYSTWKYDGKTGEKEYEYLQKGITLSTQCKMRDVYDNNDIIFKNGFRYGVDFNISCREWNMLRFKECINDNFMNRALSLLQ